MLVLLKEFRTQLLVHSTQCSSANGAMILLLIFFFQFRCAFFLSFLLISSTPVATLIATRTATTTKSLYEAVSALFSLDCSVSSSLPIFCKRHFICISFFVFVNLICVVVVADAIFYNERVFMRILKTILRKQYYQF